MSQESKISNYLTEGLRYKDMVGLVKAKIHIDEFSSKMGDDDDICVMSFYVRDDQAAQDLVNWFEKGYNYVIDADKSPGELKPNRYLVYVELKRRSNLIKQLHEMLADMETITEFEPAEWIIRYRDENYPFDVDTLEAVIPLTPRAYREAVDSELNEMRTVAGLPVKVKIIKDDFIKTLQQQAGF
jgi:hypothetical protein